MRSLVENHIGDFLDILTYQKKEWIEFWKKLPYKPITDNYANKFDGFYEKLLSISRNELTELSHWYDENKENIRDELTVRIRKSARDFQLSKEDFVIYLIVGIGEKDWIVVDGKSEKVIVFDVYSIWKKGKIDKLADAI